MRATLVLIQQGRWSFQTSAQWGFCQHPLPVVRLYFRPKASPSLSPSVQVCRAVPVCDLQVNFGKQTSLFAVELELERGTNLQRIAPGLVPHASYSTLVFSPSLPFTRPSISNGRIIFREIDRPIIIQSLTPTMAFKYGYICSIISLFEVNNCPP